MHILKQPALLDIIDTVCIAFHIPEALQRLQQENMGLCSPFELEPLVTVIGACGA
jgi:hypothetical protein